MCNACAAASVYVPKSVITQITHPPLIKYSDSELYFHDWVWMGQQLHFSWVSNQFIYSKRLMCLLYNCWGSYRALTGPWSQWDFGLKSRGLIARCSLKCKKMPLNLLGGEQCLKILLKLGNFLTSTFLLRDITNYPFGIITVSKGAQVL